MSLLLLGGTSDARHLATQLVEQGISVIYSVAGLVRHPQVPCEVVSGGFSQFGGLEKYIELRNIKAILDVTHPYADKMSTKAVEAAQLKKISCWRFHRLEWQQQEGDNWLQVNRWDEVFSLLSKHRNVLFTVGQIPEIVMQKLSSDLRFSQQKQVLRTAVKPKIPVIPSMQWVKAIGPFNVNDEVQLMKQHNINILVSKNSGGEAIVAKLHAARLLNIPVIMFARPKLPDADKIFTEKDSCCQFVVETLR